MKGNVFVITDEGERLWIVGPPVPNCHHVERDYYGHERRCTFTIVQHRDSPWIKHEFDGGEADPAPWDYVPALAHTEWTCPYCGEDNDVWGDGAINSWMECSGCFRNMFLSLDLYLSGDDWTRPPA